MSQLLVSIRVSWHASYTPRPARNGISRSKDLHSDVGSSPASTPSAQYASKTDRALVACALAIVPPSQLVMISVEITVLMNE